MLAILLFVHFPSTVVGAVVGRNITGEFKAPTRTNKVNMQCIIHHTLKCKYLILRIIVIILIIINNSNVDYIYYYKLRTF